MGIEVSGGPFQPKLFYYSNKHIILHLSVHQHAAPFSLREHFEKKNWRRWTDQRHGHTALSVFSRRSVGTRSGRHHKVLQWWDCPTNPALVRWEWCDMVTCWWAGCHPTWSCATVSSPVQVPVKAVLIFPLVSLLMEEIRKESQYPEWISSSKVCPHPLGKICCLLQWWRSYPRLFTENKSECLYELQSSSQFIPLN